MPLESRIGLDDRLLKHACCKAVGSEWYGPILKARRNYWRLETVKNLLSWTLGAAIVVLVMGCSSTEFHPPEYVRLESSPAGRILLGGYKRHGFPDWIDQQALVFNLRTRESGEGEVSTRVEQYALDLENQRFCSKGNRGAVSVRRIYSDSVFDELLDGQKNKDPKALLKGRHRLLSDYYFTVLPFLPARYPNAEIEESAIETINGVKYSVVEVNWGVKGPMPPEKVCRLYYTLSTHRLEKIFFQTDALGLEGKYVWCECDNFARFDGVLLALHREYTLARDQNGEKIGPPFREQWIYEVSFEGSVDETLFY